jgi:hypothetical protein
MGEETKGIEKNCQETYSRLKEIQNRQSTSEAGAARKLGTATDCCYRRGRKAGYAGCMVTTACEFA